MTKRKNITKILNLILFCIIVVLGTCFSCASFVLSQGNYKINQPLSLEDCKNIALSINPKIKEALARLDASLAIIGKEKSLELPSINFTYSLNHSLNPKGPPVISNVAGEPRTFQSQSIAISTFKDQVTISQLVYDGGKVASRIKALKAISKEQSLMLKEEERQLSLNVTKSFYEVLTATQLVRVNDENLLQAKEHLRLAVASFNAGIVAKADVAFARVPLAKAELELTKAKNNLQLGMANLVSLMGLDVNTMIELKDVFLSSAAVNVSTINDAFLSLEEGLNEALANRTDLLALKERINAEEESFKAVKAGKFPTVLVSGGYGWTGYSKIDLPEFPGGNIGAIVTFPLYDGKLNKHEIKEAIAILEQAKNSLEVLKDQVELEVKGAYLNLVAAKEKERAALVALEYAKENLKLVEAQYKNGLVSIINLVDSRTAYLVSQTDVINSRYEHEQAKAVYLLAIGRH